MPVFEIWDSGYRATGECSYAHRLGSAWGISFKAACITFFYGSNDPRKHTDFDPDTMTYWGCKLFPDGEEAKKHELESFGPSRLCAGATSACCGHGQEPSTVIMGV